MQYRKLTELKKLEGNPRIIRDKQFKTLCDSIKNMSKGAKIKEPFQPCLAIG